MKIRRAPHCSNRAIFHLYSHHGTIVIIFTIAYQHDYVVIIIIIIIIFLFSYLLLRCIIPFVSPLSLSLFLSFFLSFLFPIVFVSPSLKNKFLFLSLFTILARVIDPRRRGSPVSSLVWRVNQKKWKTASNCPKHKKLLRLQITNEITDFRWWFDRGEGAAHCN